MTEPVWSVDPPTHSVSWSMGGPIKARGLCAPGTTAFTVCLEGRRAQGLDYEVGRLYMTHVDDEIDWSKVTCEDCLEWKHA